MMDTYQTLIIAAITGGVSSIATVVAVRVDIQWIKKCHISIDKRVTTLENRIIDLMKV
ncbi:hypothetical protein HGG78_14625 [Vibrio aestuarianus]|nr:hypothetical protein [Vibrio aestuarianus]NKZ51118.1 hypothetical protein [Vibrio aestuarianus]